MNHRPALVEEVHDVGVDLVPEVSDRRGDHVECDAVGTSLLLLRVVGDRVLSFERLLIVAALRAHFERNHIETKILHDALEAVLPSFRRTSRVVRRRAAHLYLFLFVSIKL